MTDLTPDQLAMVHILITAAFAVLLALGLWLGRKVASLVEKKTGIAVAERFDTLLDSAITHAIAYAEEQAHKAADRQLSGPQKLQIAEEVARTLAPAQTAPLAPYQLHMLIEAKLPSVRSGSVPPALLSIPPPPLPPVDTAAETQPDRPRPRRDRP